MEKGDAYLFWLPRRVQWWSSLAEQPLPANSLTRNSLELRLTRIPLSVEDAERWKDAERSGSAIGIFLGIIIQAETSKKPTAVDTTGV